MRSCARQREKEEEGEEEEEEDDNEDNARRVTSLHCRFDALNTDRPLLCVTDMVTPSPASVRKYAVDRPPNRSTMPCPVPGMLQTMLPPYCVDGGGVPRRLCCTVDHRISRQWRTCMSSSAVDPSSPPEPP